MLNELDREDAWLRFEQMGCFDLGAMEAWEWWFKNIWRRLEASRWFQEVCVRDSPVYATQQRITLFALRWLGEDFVNVLDGSSDPEWDEWVRVLGLDAGKLLDVVRGHGQWPPIEADICDELGEAEVYQDPEETERAREIYDDELMARLLPQAACFAAVLQRQRLVPWLRRIFVRSEHLFQSLWSVAHCGSAGPFGESFQDSEEEAVPIDQGWPFAHDADPDLTAELAEKLNSIAMAAFADSLDFDAGTATRMQAWEWVENGCHIRNQGYPQYAGPGLD